MKLFIIGNGFDLAHGMPTAYCDFRDYLEHHNEVFLNKLENDYDVGIGETPDPINDLWRDFESTLGNHDGYSIGGVDDYKDLGLEYEHGKEGLVEYDLSNRFDYVRDINVLLTEWVESIEIPVSVKSSKIVASNDDLFFSFNYTLVLEKLYGINENNVLHIHGSIAGNTYEPVIGHGNKDAIQNMEDEAFFYKCDLVEDEKTGNITIEYKSGEYDKIKCMQYEQAATFLKELEKDVPKYLQKNSSFFDRLNVVNEVHLLGHSLGEVDEPYFNKIIEKTDNKIEWILWYYKDNKMSDEELTDKLDEFESKLLGLGINKTQITFKDSCNFFDV